MTEPARGFLLQPTYRVRNARPVVQLFGVLEDGGAFLVEDDRSRPFFYAPRAAADWLRRSADVGVKATDRLSLEGVELVRVETRVPGEVPPLRERLASAGFEALEADVRFAYRYLIDLGLRASFEIHGSGDRVESELVRYRNPDLVPAHVRPHLRVLSLDIETAPDASRTLSVALALEGQDEVHVVARKAPPDAIAHPSERALLEATARRVRELDPDVLTGWNVIDFDLRVLERRAHALGVPFDLGRVPGRTVLRRDPGFTRQSRADVPGRQVLDGPGLLRDAFITLEDYRLETAARTLLGRGKRIDEAASADRGGEIERMYREDLPAFVAYNREDARLVLDILKQESLLELAVERSLLAGMPLDRVGASIATFDRIYLPELARAGYVAPSVDSERKRGPVTGGAVLDSHPGLYRNVGLFDFKSLYPSLIRTFGLDPLAHALAGEDAVEAPNGARFARSGAILPGLLDDFFEGRAAARARGDRHADLAIKIMMNALYGVLGAASCRFFDPDIANAISGFGQQLLGWTRDSFESRGVRVLYGDTDSVFVALDPELDSAHVREAAEALRAAIECELADRIRSDYRVEPRLELELEHVYSRFFQPSVRGGRQGSKKRYAGLVSGDLEIVGLEAVRSDWPAVAGRLQRGLLSRLFADREPESLVREIVSRLKDGELDQELVIRKRVRKGSLERYTRTTPPHVQAARKLGSTSGGVIRYVIAREGPEPVAEGRPFPAHPDYDYYLDRVLRPVADSILEQVDSSFDRALGHPTQLSLL